MSRFRLRLIAIVTMFSYLVTSFHASIGLCATPVREQQSAESPQTTQDQQAEQSPQTQEPAPQQSRCTHCVEKQKKVEQSGETGSVGKSDDYLPCPRGQDEEPCDDSCPCCPKGPGGKPCHVPGGCAYCNVAKVPCMSEGLLCHEPAPCTHETTCELSSFYTSPPCGGLSRPPKA